MLGEIGTSTVTALEKYARVRLSQTRLKTSALNATLGRAQVLTR